MRSVIPNILFVVAICTGGAGHAQSSWDGAYLGASLATASGNDLYDNGSESAEFELEGQLFGAFAGYNLSFGNYVAGGEVAFQSGEVNEEGFEGEYEYTTLIDLKGRIGTEISSVLAYGILGASLGTFSINEAGDPTRDFDQTETALLWGLGVEYAASEQFSIGAEFISRKFEFEFPLSANLADMTGDLKSLSLRASYRF
jgi:opacity protein-like surface antigen